MFFIKKTPALYGFKTNQHISIAQKFVCKKNVCYFLKILKIIQRRAQTLHQALSSSRFKTKDRPALQWSSVSRSKPHEHLQEDLWVRSNLGSGASCMRDVDQVKSTDKVSGQDRVFFIFITVWWFHFNTVLGKSVDHDLISWASLNLIWSKDRRICLWLIQV